MFLDGVVLFYFFWGSVYNFVVSAMQTPFKITTWGGGDRGRSNIKLSKYVLGMWGNNDGGVGIKHKPSKFCVETHEVNFIRKMFILRWIKLRKD